MAEPKIGRAASVSTPKAERTQGDGSAIPRRIADFTADWLTEILRAGGCIRQARVTGVQAKTIGEGVGFLDILARIRLTYDRQEPGAPASVIVKAPAAVEANREVGDSIHAYEREVRFYADVAPHSPIRLARCYYTAMNPEANEYILVLEDLATLVPGDQVAGVTAARARAAVQTIGRFHAQWWQKPELEALSWIPLINRDLATDYHQHWPEFVRKLGHFLTPAEVALGAQAGSHFDRVQTAMTEAPHTIVHCDFRADNMLFDDASATDPVVVLDWQCATRGKGVFDVARLSCGSMSPAEGAAHEMELLRLWHETLQQGGVRGYPFEQALVDYKIGALYCLFVPVVFHDLVEAGGERGVALARAMLDRYFAAVVELNAGSVLPA